MLHHILEDSVRNIADEEIMLRMPVRQQRGQRVRVFSYHRRTFVFSGTDVKIRVFRYRCKDFSYLDSCFQVPAHTLSY